MHNSRRFRSIWSSLRRPLCAAGALFLALPLAMPLAGQNSSLESSPKGIRYAQGRSWASTLFGQAPIPVAPADLRNSARVYTLLHNGRLTLTLDDAIALALENNLDIAIQRYNIPIADTDILRTSSGQPFRGVSTGLVEGTPGGGAATATGAGASGTGSGGTIPGQGGAGAGAAGIVSSTLGAGPAALSFDPTFGFTFQDSDQSTPESITFLTGTSQLISHTGEANFTYNQAWSPGTSVAVAFNNNRQTTNDAYTLFNPTLNSGLTVTLTQPLLAGFGSSINGRNLTIAKNNREISDVAFRQQVEYTVTQVEEIYWDTVSARDSVAVAQQALSLAQTILSDDQKQVRIGTMIPLDVDQQESAVATDEQSLTVAATNYEYQKLLLLNAVTKNLSDPALSGADVVPTDSITVSANEPVQPIQDLINEALEQRPELAISRINITNQLITMKAIRNELEPQLNLVASYAANGLAGTTVIPTAVFPGLGITTAGIAPFVGGYGTGFDSMIRGDYPSYTLGFTLSIPIRNRAGQADAVRAQLELRQAQLQYQQSTNEIVLEVRNAQFTLQQDRAAVAAAQQAVRLDEATLAADRKRVAFGAALTTAVITDESSLTQARQNLVAALSNYQISKVQLDELTGHTLAADRISIQDAENGHVTQLPQALR